MIKGKLLMNDLNYTDNQELCSDKIIVLRDKGSCSIRFKNNMSKEFYKVKVDDGLIKDVAGINLSKCDYIIYSANNQDVVAYIELKGSNTDLAIKQLKSTISLTKKDFRSYLSRRAYISSNTSPKTQYRKQQLQFNKETKAVLYFCKPQNDNEL